MEPARARVEAFYDAVERRDLEAALGLVPDDFEWDLSRRQAEPGGILRGRDGGRLVIQALLDAWVELRFERQAEETVGDRMIVPLRVVGRGASSAIAVADEVVHVWRTRGHEVVALEYHSTVASAKAAVRDS